MRKVLAVLALLLLTGLAASQSLEERMDSMIAKECPVNYEPVISMEHPNMTYSNPGHPAYFDYKLCIKGIEEAKIGGECEYGASFYISSNKTEAHLSLFRSYNLPVCTGQMMTSTRESCLENQTALMSVSSDHNAHVGHPEDMYDQKLCAFYAPPENVTVEAEFNLTGEDKVYWDDQEENGGGDHFYAEYPYIVSEGDSTVAGIVSRDMIKLRRELEEKNRFSMRKDGGSFLIPFTRGSYRNIEDDEEAVLEGDFLDQLRPSFSFYSIEESIIKTALKPDITIKSNISTGKGYKELEITKTGENEVTITKK